MDKDQMWWMAFVAALSGMERHDGAASGKVAHAAAIADESLKIFEQRFPGRMGEVQQVPGTKGGAKWR
jgi:hypothetical protein